jgi:hypothetical protein
VTLHRNWRCSCSLLPAACCLLPAACCLLPAACCLLPAACCLLPVLLVLLVFLLLAAAQSAPHFDRFTPDAAGTWALARRFTWWRALALTGERKLAAAAGASLRCDSHKPASYASLLASTAQLSQPLCCCFLPLACSGSYMFHCHNTVHEGAWPAAAAAASALSTQLGF